MTRAKVEVVGATVRIIEVPREGLTIGRSPANGLVLDAASVSGKHARVFFRGDDVMIEDLGSRYGMRRDGVHFTAPTLLRDGDELLVGGAVVLRVYVLGRGSYGTPLSELEDTANSLKPQPKGPTGNIQPLGVDLLPIIESLFSATSFEDLGNRIAEAARVHFGGSRAALIELDDKAMEKTKSAAEHGRFRILGLAGATTAEFVSRTVVAEALRKSVACHVHGASGGSNLSLSSKGAMSAVGAVLRPRDGRARVIYLDTSPGTPALNWSHASSLQLFSAHAAAAFDVLGAQLEMAEQRVRFENLRRFFAPAVVDQLLKTNRDVKPTVTHATVVFADLSGYTALAERLADQPEALVALLNRWLDAGARAVMGHGGTLDKFIGDAVMAVFGVPLPAPEGEVQAVRCALEMQSGMAMLSKELGERLDITVGINSGPVIAATVGSKRRLEYTVLGDTVNVAARLQSKAERGQILVGATTAAKLHDDVELEDAGALALKNHAPVRAFRVKKLKL